jgi:serine/threonine-protein kinase
MSDKARAGIGEQPPSTDGSDDSQNHESWLREAARVPQVTRLPKVGDLIGGKYRIEAQLGRGGMGVVFRAHHAVSERPVAIKWMLRPGTDEQAQRRFEREARAAGRIDHPNVVSLFDIGEDGECSYLVMELLRGEALRDRLARGPLQPTEAVDILIPAMRGVAAAHRVGVIHRDLKPDNIFLCRESDGGHSVPKVLDFGISSVASLEAVDTTLTQEGTLLGSLPYMSPEQLRNPHDVDGRADIYAFGVILYELLAGALPFAGVNHTALIVAISTKQPKALSQVRPDVPSGLEQVVFRAFAREPDDRYPDIAGLIDALLPFASVRLSSGLPANSVGAAPAVSGQPDPGAGGVIGNRQVVSVALTPVEVAVFRSNVSSRSRIVWATAALIALLALIAMFAGRSGQSAPKASRPVEAAAPTQTSVLVDEPPPTAPTAPVAPVDPPAAVRVEQPLLPMALPSAMPEPPRVRAARSKAARNAPSASGTSARDSKESSLFSGRK